MATILREVLNSQDMRLSIYCGGHSYVGIRLFGSWTGTAKFYGSTDGINFDQISVTPWPSGTDVSSATANGNFYVPVLNYLAIQVRFTTLTTGTLSVVMAASQDASYQDAFLAASSIFVSQSATGVNTITQAAQTNRAWKVKEITVSVSGPTVWTGGGTLQVLDGSGGTVLWSEYLEQGSGSVGHRYTVTLPANGITGTPGNAMQLVLSSPGGGVTSTINAEFSAA